MTEQKPDHCDRKVCACKSTMKVVASEELQKQVAAEMDVADKPLRDLLHGKQPDDKTAR